MKLLIARHGEALNVGENGISRDIDRPLSSVGQSQIKYVSSCLLHHKISIDLLISSPYVRTLQTRDIFAKELAVKNVEQDDLMQSGAKAEDVDALFQEYDIWEKYIDKTVMIVGHAPDVGRICDFYLGTKGFFFNPGNVAMIRFTAPECVGQLSAFWSPDLLAK